VTCLGTFPLIQRLVGIPPRENGRESRGRELAALLPAPRGLTGRHYADLGRIAPNKLIDQLLEGRQRNQVHHHCHIAADFPTLEIEIDVDE
jgi:hypothetical protein